MSRIHLAGLWLIAIGWLWFGIAGYWRQVHPEPYQFREHRNRYEWIYPDGAVTIWDCRGVFVYDAAGNLVETDITHDRRD